MGFFSGLFRRSDKLPDIQDALLNELSEEIKREEEAANTEYENLAGQEQQDPRFEGMRIGLVYKDADGRRTRRVVRVRRLDGSHFEGYLMGHCELRNEVRTFLTSRIETLFDPSTGELLDAPTEYFGHFFDAKDEEFEQEYQRRKFRLAWPIVEALKHELRVLILVARADGRFVKAEQELLLRYAANRAADEGLDVDDMALVVLRDWVKVQDPSEPEARIAIKTLASKPGALEALWEVAELMAEADGKVKPEERDTVLEIRETIQAVASDLG